MPHNVCASPCADLPRRVNRHLLLVVNVIGCGRVRAGIDDRRPQTGPRRQRTRTIPAMAFERITIDPARMGGVPCIRDLRVTVSMVLGQLAAGRSAEELLKDYPYLERADVTAALEYAAAIVNEREIPVNRPA